MTEAQTVADLAVKAAGEPRFVKNADGREFLIVPDGCTSTDVTPQDALPLYQPHYVKQLVTVQTADSLVDYVNRYRLDNTVLLADIDGNKIVAVIDYHAAAAAGVSGAADRLGHRATLQLAFSTEWADWTKINGVLQSQLEFARFIEENGADVRAPAAADLLECVRDLQAVRKADFTSSVRTATDHENFEWVEATDARTKKGALEIPAKFELGIPVYFGEPDVELYAFLRWKLDDGKLRLGIALHRAEHVRQAVFQAVVRDLAARTGCPAVFGKI